MAACSTVWVSAAEVLVVKLVSPPYTAVMLWSPTASAEVVKLAVPLVRVPVPSVVSPSMKVTLPVGVPLPDEEATVAVKVTESP